MTITYQKGTKLDSNSFVTPPEIDDPKDLPQPLGWNILVRPYPIAQTTSFILPEDDINFMNFNMNIGRVVSIGPCCWNRPHHKNSDGERFNWVEVGDFVAYPKNTGNLRKFKGVSFVILNDDQVVEQLPDPMVLDGNGYFKLNIPQDHLEKYNTVYNKKRKSK